VPKNNFKNDTAIGLKRNRKMSNPIPKPGPPKKPLLPETVKTIEEIRALTAALLNDDNTVKRVVQIAPPEPTKPKAKPQRKPTKKFERTPHLQNDSLRNNPDLQNLQKTLEKN
jgi:hypothetical protein